MERSVIAYLVIVAFIVAWLLFVIFAIAWRIAEDVQHLLQSGRIEIEYTCVHTRRGAMKAAVFDTEKERRCGLDCVDIKAANVTIFIWQKTPKKVTFVSTTAPVTVYHVVNGVVYNYVFLHPGENVTFIAVTENDYFIKARFDYMELFDIGSRVYYTVCKGE